MRNALSGLAISLATLTLSCSAVSPPPSSGEGTTTAATTTATPATTTATATPTDAPSATPDAPPGGCDKPGRKYTGKNADICSRIRFFCEPGFKAFHDDNCGCGCEPEAVQNPPPPAKPGVACGKNTCPADQECCNPSCGICTPKGGACIEKVCN